MDASPLRLRRVTPLVLNSYLPEQKNKGEETSSPLFLAGAVGLEPTTNGFGVAQNVIKPCKIYRF